MFSRQRRAAADEFFWTGADQSWPTRRRRHSDVGAQLYSEVCQFEIERKYFID